MPDAAWTAFGIIAAAALAAFATLFGQGWWQRRQIARLTDAEADNTSAETLEIVDRIARGWITELRDEVSRLRLRVIHVETERHERDTHIDVLEQHINDQKPPPPPPRPWLFR